MRGRGVPIARERDGMVDGVASFDEVVGKMRRDVRVVAEAKSKASRLAQAKRTLQIMDALA